METVRARSSSASAFNPPPFAIRGQAITIIQVPNSEFWITDSGLGIGAKNVYHDGMKIFFETTVEDLEKAADMAIPRAQLISQIDVVNCFLESMIGCLAKRPPTSSTNPHLRWLDENENFYPDMNEALKTWKAILVQRGHC